MIQNEYKIGMIVRLVPTGLVQQTYWDYELMKTCESYEIMKLIQ